MPDRCQESPVGLATVLSISVMGRFTARTRTFHNEVLQPRETLRKFFDVVQSHSHCPNYTSHAVHGLLGGATSVGWCRIVGRNRSLAHHHVQRILWSQLEKSCRLSERRVLRLPTSKQAKSRRAPLVAMSSPPRAHDMEIGSVLQMLQESKELYVCFWRSSLSIPLTRLPCPLCPSCARCSLLFLRR